MFQGSRLVSNGVMCGALGMYALFQGILLDGSIWTGVRGIDFLFRGTDSRRSSPFGCVSRRHYECKLRNSIVCLLCIIDGVDHVSRE